MTSQLKNYIVATGVFIIAVVNWHFSIFCRSTAFCGRKISQRTMMNNVKRQSEHLRSILAIHYQYLNGLAKEMGRMRS